VQNKSLFILIILIVIFFIVSGPIWYCFYNDPQGATKIYDGFLRQSLFTGFLTLGGFLLSMKTFVLVNVKKDVYDSNAYSKFLKECRSNGLQVERYASLYQLQFGLTLSIVLSLFASASQFTFGLLNWWWAKAIASTVATLALSFVLWSVWLLYANTKIWIDYADREKHDD
jgi:hypothetical protein